jgi:3-oxoacyl-[acyl-carrier protein] reductase
MDIRLDNKTILINGVTGAIAGRVAEKCVSRGADVFGIFGKDRQEAERLSKEKNIKVLSIDLCKEKITRDLIKNFLADRKIFGLVNAAGAVIDKPLVRLTDKDWDDVVNVNLTSIFYLTRAVLPMIEPGGRIINLSSTAGLIGSAGQSNYAAAKAGLWAFTKSLSREAAKSGIMVNMVLPGFILSKMTGLGSSGREAGPDNGMVYGLMRERARKESLTGEFITPEVVAEFIVYLVSDYSDGITGQAFNIDNRIRRWW